MGTIVGGTGAPLSFSSASGGKVYGYNNINETTATVVAKPNSARQRIRFHNPAANDIFVGPVNVQNVLGTAPTQPSNVPLVPTNAALGGMFRVFGNGGTLDITGECQGGWQALAVTGAGTTNQLTVMDSNN
jgi:hypothetical protein